VCGQNKKKWARNCDDSFWVLGDSEGQEEVFVSTDFGTSFLEATAKNSCTATCAVEQ
jgi:hypothetical protein